MCAILFFYRIIYSISVASRRSSSYCWMKMLCYICCQNWLRETLQQFRHSCMHTHRARRWVQMLLTPRRHCSALRLLYTVVCERWPFSMTPRPLPSLSLAKSRKQNIVEHNGQVIISNVVLKAVAALQHTQPPMSTLKQRPGQLWYSIVASLL